MYNSKNIAIVINGVGVQLLGNTDPSIAKSGAFSEVKTGINGDNHNRAINGVYDILTLNLKYNSPNIDQLESLAENHQEFSATYKDKNTGKTYNSVKAVCRELGENSGDADRTFTIDFL
jgi:hypothetical protein